ncbi:MAG: carbohydrate ABC transporter permease, partial [Thermomicrobiales bacterium]
MASIARPGRRKGAAATEALGNWLFLLPAVAFFVLWQIWPIVQVAWISFTDFKFLDTNAPTTVFGLPRGFIGFDNYKAALQDDLLWQGLKRALLFTALFVPGMILIPMVIATLVDRVSNGKIATTYRLILLIPSMIPGPLIFVLWKWMYDLYIG